MTPQSKIYQLSLNCYLQPLACKLPSFIKDTIDLLNRIEDLNWKGPFPEGTLLVSWDVKSMFPNTDNRLGLSAVKKAPNAGENQLPSTNCILEAVEICFKSNHLVFKENLFLQIHGTAMGPKNACSYADLAVGKIDFQATFSGPIKPASWWRYHDDVFDLWQQGLPALHEFTWKTITFLYIFAKPFSLTKNEGKIFLVTKPSRPLCERLPLKLHYRF